MTNKTMISLFKKGLIDCSLGKQCSQTRRFYTMVAEIHKQESPKVLCKHYHRVFDAVPLCSIVRISV